MATEFYVTCFLCTFGLVQALLWGSASRTLFYIFNFIFYIAAPYIRIQANSWAYGIDSHEPVIAWRLIIFSILIFEASYWVSACFRPNTKALSSTFTPPKSGYGSYPDRLYSLLINLLALTFAALALLILAKYGGDIFSRSGKALQRLFGGGSSGQMASYFIRPIPVFMAVLLYWHERNNQQRYFRPAFFLFLFASLTLSYPPALPRVYLLPFVFLTLLLIFDSPKRFSRFITLCLPALVYLSMVWSYSRYGFNLAALFPTKYRIENFFLSGNFDAFENNIHSFNYANSYGHTLGEQTLSVILFFVPRSLWAEKGLPTGDLLTEEYLGWLYAFVKNFNISAPLIGTGFIEAALWGVAVFFALLGWLCRKSDLLHTHCMQQLPHIKLTQKIYLSISLAFVFFVQRGDLIVAVSYYTAMFIAAYLAALICNRTFRAPVHSSD